MISARAMKVYRIMRRTMLMVAIAMFGLCAVPAFASQVISLVVDARDTPQKILHVTLTIPVKSGPLHLHYPKWIPGVNGPSAPIASLTGLHLKGDGKEISWKRDALDAFTFHTHIPAGVDSLEVTYDFILPAGKSATAKLASLEWNEVVLYPSGAPVQKLLYRAEIILPRDWKFGTALQVARQSADRIAFAPVALDELVDSPVIIGRYFRSFDITPPGESIRHQIDIAADAEAALAMRPEVRAKLTRLVSEAGKLFGSRHYRRYHFLLILSDHVAHSGLEHHQSSNTRLPERALLSADAAMTIGSILPHEYVHSWNGKFRRPVGLTPAYYSDPMRGDLLWNYEGMTEFLGHLLAVRSGLWTPDQYHEYLASIAARMGPGRPGRTWRSLYDTSIGLSLGFAPTWISWRRGADFYFEGDLIWLEAATIIREQSGGTRSIDDFSRDFFGGSNMGPRVETYTLKSLVDALHRVAPYDWEGFFQERLDSHAPAAPMGGIENSGWKLIFNDQPPRLPGQREADGEIYSIGLALGPDGTVRDAVAGGAAFKAGITFGMKIFGINGRVYSSERFTEALRRSTELSDPISLLVLSDDYFKVVDVNYRGGLRYPHLVRKNSKPDYLQIVTKSRTLSD